MALYQVSRYDDVYLDRIRCLISDNLSCGTSDPAKILPHVYLGSQMNAESLRLLRRIGITHVLNCAAFDGQIDSPYKGLGIDYYQFHAKDTENYNIIQHFTEAFNFLDGVKRRGGLCLVHCAMGINRSAAIAVGYIMMTKGLPLLEIIEYIAKRRRVILSNEGFRRQLVEYARSKGLLDRIDEPKPEEQELEDWTPVHERYLDREDSNRASRFGSLRGSLSSSDKPPTGRYHKRAYPTPIKNGYIPTMTFYRTPESSRRGVPWSTPSLSRSRSVERSSSPSRDSRSIRSQSTERTYSSSASSEKPVGNYAVMFLYNKFMNRDRVY